MQDKLYWWWASTRKMTVGFATTKDASRHTVAVAPPIIRKFIGQDVKRLGQWMRRQGGFRAERLGEDL